MMTNEVWFPPKDETPHVPLFTRRNLMRVTYAFLFGAVLGAGAGWFMLRAREHPYLITVKARLLPSESEKERLTSDVWAEEQRKAFDDAAFVAGFSFRRNPDRDRDVIVETQFDANTLNLDVTLTGGVKSACETGVTAFFDAFKSIKDRRAQDRLAKRAAEMEEMRQRFELETETLAEKLGCEPWGRTLTDSAKTLLAENEETAAAHKEWSEHYKSLEVVRMGLKDAARREGLGLPRTEVTKPPGEAVQTEVPSSPWDDFLLPALKGGGAFAGLTLLVIVLKHKAKTRPPDAPGAELKPATEF